LNIIGDSQRPVKIYNSSFLVGYTSAGAGFGTNNAYISGQVGINTTDTKGYQFAVNGSAIATSFTVKTNANWPDYVFRSAYHLPSLYEVKTYIDVNHHLPEIPSEQEITANGLDLGDIDRLLTKKVEELTLYLIQKDKQLDEQAQATKILQQKVEQLTKQMELLVSKTDKTKSKN
jgi:hypothetical protein